jgi:hypothetical protein
VTASKGHRRPTHTIREGTNNFEANAKALSEIFSILVKETPNSAF